MTDLRAAGGLPPACSVSWIFQSAKPDPALSRNANLRYLFQKREQSIWAIGYAYICVGRGSDPGIGFGRLGRTNGAYPSEFRAAIAARGPCGQ